jgi:hypothetical protein
MNCSCYAGKGLEMPGTLLCNFLPNREAYGPISKLQVIILMTFSQKVAEPALFPHFPFVLLSLQLTFLKTGSAATVLPVESIVLLLLTF